MQADDTNLQQTNEFYYTLHGYPINFVLGYCIAAAPDPARDYWCVNCSFETQATQPMLNQLRFFAVHVAAVKRLIAGQISHLVLIIRMNASCSARLFCWQE